MQETKLNLGDKLNIANYSFYHNPRPGSRFGGTGIYIKNNIPHRKLSNPPIRQAETTLVEIKLNDNLIVVVGSIYVRPTADTTFTFDIENLLSLNSKIILAGDFNCKHRHWDCSRANRNGTHLYNFVNNANLNVIAPDVPTRYSNTSATIIDFAIVRDFNFSFTTDVVDEISSDHRPVLINFDLNLQSSKDTIFLKTNWDKCNEILEDKNLNFSPIDNVNELNLRVQELTDNKSGP